MPGPPKLPFKEFDWTPQLTWAVGLLATDGCLSNNGRTIILRSSDLQLLNTFKKSLALTAKIGITQPGGFSKKHSYRIQFGDVQLYRWLLTIGLTPAKTYSIDALRIPDEYFRDFLRGHLDGDGTITIYKDRYNTYKNPKYIYDRLWLRFISASETHMKWVQSVITRLTSVEGHLNQDKKIRNKHGKVRLWQLKFGKKDSIKLLNWIYYHPDIPCLERKRMKAEPFLTKQHQT